MSEPHAESLVAGAVNFRDVGGLPAEGGTTRFGVLYRSGNLAHLEPAGIEAMRELGVRRIIDLRDEEEVVHAPSRVEGLDLDTVRVPLFLGSVASFFDEDMSLASMYAAMIEGGGDRIVSVARGILGARPALVHCTVGKDRTGVSVAVILAAVGVEEEAVIADYARTESMLPAWRNQAVVDRLRAMHPEAVNLVDLATRSPAEVMRALLGSVRARNGSAAAYLQANGLGADELAELRELLIARA